MAEREAVNADDNAAILHLHNRAIYALAVAVQCPSPSEEITYANNEFDSGGE